MHEEIFEKELIKVENGKWKCPHILLMNVKPLNEGFIFPLISLSSLLASIF